MVLPAGSAGLPSEYETLTANLGAAYPGSLGALQEGNGRSDITYLANKTGWDARAVALAALADQFSQITAPNDPPAADPAQTAAWPLATSSLQPEFYYALFRAGLPASPDTLFQTDPGTVQAVWQQAAAQGVIPQSLAGDIPGAVQSFQTLSAARVLSAAPAAGISTLQEMLQPTLPEAFQQRQFAQLYAQHQGDWASFWPAAEQLFGAAATAQLQMTGQLYALTVNNQPLVSALMTAEAGAPLTSTQDLAARGYYTPGKWAPLIGSSIPPGIPGADADEQASNYAQLLAAQVRIAFPTAVLADQVAQRHPARHGHRADRHGGGRFPDHEPGPVRDRCRAGRGLSREDRPDRNPRRRGHRGQAAAAGVSADPRRRRAWASCSVTTSTRRSRSPATTRTALPAPSPASWAGRTPRPRSTRGPGRSSPRR